MPIFTEQKIILENECVWDDRIVSHANLLASKDELYQRTLPLLVLIHSRVTPYYENFKAPLPN